MGFKEYLDQQEKLEEAPKKGFPEKFIGKTLTAKQDIYIITQEDITSDEEGDIFTEKEMKKEFLWMKKGFKTKLEEGQLETFLSSSNAQFDFSEELIDRLLNGRLIAIK